MECIEFKTANIHCTLGIHPLRWNFYKEWFGCSDNPSSCTVYNTSEYSRQVGGWVTYLPKELDEEWTKWEEEEVKRKLL